jgi:hypothetical protein
MDYVIYEDKPRTDIWLKLVFVLPSAALLISALILLKTDPGGALYFIYGVAGTALLMGSLYILILPTRYNILNDKIKIQFRGPLSFNIPFDTIAGVRDARWSTVGVNFPTNMSQAAVLEIVRKGRMPVTITPSDKQAFIQSFQKAFEDWKRGKDS